MWFVAFILTAFLAIGASMWIISMFINKSNNRGDSKALYENFASTPLIIDDREDDKSREIALR